MSPQKAVIFLNFGLLSSIAFPTIIPCSTKRLWTLAQRTGALPSPLKPHRQREVQKLAGRTYFETSMSSWLARFTRPIIACLLHTGAIQLRGGVNRSKMRTNELSGYVHVSFGSEPKGADTDKHKQKHRPFHCIIWLLYHPDDIVTFEEANNDHHVSHFCHRGICANVWDHLDLVPEKFNLSQNGCIFGSAVTCPHRPKRCIFVDIRGNPLPCLNNPQTVSSNCIHDPNCFKSRLLPGVAETGVITIEGTQRKRKQPAETANEEKN
jgi:hypothetical protein